MIDEMKRDDSADYLKILKALLELPFNVGKNLLADFLTGNYKNKSIVKNNLDELNWFDSLSWDRKDVLDEIEKLIDKGMIESVQSDFNKFIKVLRITLKGQNEIIEPKLMDTTRFSQRADEVTEEDRNVFENYRYFLEGYNEGQKKAIVSDSEKILCVAGAGSGKTSVLTKRIEFLVKHRGVFPEKVLAITFTRKARKEMQRRLNENGIDARVETFNSFSEKILRRNANKIYDRPVRVQSYGDKIMAMTMALENLGLDVNSAVDSYFSDAQKKFNEPDRLSINFMNDCFSVLDYFKVRNEDLYDFSHEVEEKDRDNAKMIYEVCKFIDEHMKVQGMRDFTDQILDTLRFFRRHPEDIPQFEHILVDEYQDVNGMQIQLLNFLNPLNLFAVGDPRQSIYGWRGSSIKYILDFEKDYPDCEIIHLVKNYRSKKDIVEISNHSIKEMNLPDLEHHHEGESEMKLVGFNSEEEEMDFIINKVRAADYPRREIFVLARTNRQLKELSRKMAAAGIKHVLKTDEVKRSVEAGEEEVTLATIHAIKGLEAGWVFVMGANEQNFPCKASDHPVIEMIKMEQYDREEEEKRLFYVAISRAKEKLYLTYSGNKATKYITEEMMKMFD